MAQTMTVCQVSDDVTERLKKLRFRKEKTIAAIMLKVNQKTMLIEMEEEYDDCSIEELQQELCQHQPRYLVISYVHDHGDGRISYPLIFIYCCPPGAKPDLNVMYAGGIASITTTLQATKQFEIRDSEDLTEEWLKEMLRRK